MWRKSGSAARSFSGRRERDLEAERRLCCQPAVLNANSISYVRITQDSPPDLSISNLQDRTAPGRVAYKVVSQRDISVNYRGMESEDELLT